MCQFSWTTELHSFDPDAPSSRERRLLLVFIVKTVPVCQCVTFSSTLQYYLQLPWYWNTFTFYQYDCCLIISFLWVSFNRSAIDGCVLFLKEWSVSPPSHLQLDSPHLANVTPHRFSAFSPPRPFLFWCSWLPTTISLSNTTFVIPWTKRKWIKTSEHWSFSLLLNHAILFCLYVLEMVLTFDL